MRATTTLLTLLLVSACGGGEDAAPADEAESMAEEMAPSMADFAGTWEGINMLEGTPDPVSSTLQVSDDGSEWFMILEGRDPIPATANIVGDSLVLVTDQYESILRDGVMVTVRTAGVMDGPDRMVGTMVATYDTPTVRRLSPAPPRWCATGCSPDPRSLHSGPVGSFGVAGPALLTLGLEVTERDLSGEGLAGRLYYVLGLFILGGLDLRARQDMRKPQPAKRPRGVTDSAKWAY